MKNWRYLWFIAVGLLFAIFGLLLAFFNDTELFSVLISRRIDPIFFSAGVLPAESAAFQKWVYGVLGSTCAGWGVTVAMIAYHAMKHEAAWALPALLPGVLVWFVPDTVISLRSEVYLNAGINVMLLAMVLLPFVCCSKRVSNKR